MIRLLLSLLALVSGLVVQGTPARAQLCPAHDTEIGAPVPARIAAQVPASAVVDRVPAVRVASIALRLPAAFAVAHPGVLIGIDRARE